MSTRKKGISILQWSGYLTDEAGEIMWKKFLWTDITKKILLVLEHTKGGIIGIAGLQGIGKTTTLHALQHKLEELINANCVFIKWTSNWKETVSDDIEWDMDPVYDELLNKTYTDKTGYIRRSAKIEGFENELGKGTVKKLREEVIFGYLAESEYVFVDFPDYSKESIRQMNSDLDSFQETWRLLQKNYKTKATFVLAIQQELMEQHKHFLWGKIRLFQLEPYTAQNMLELYLRFHETYSPFTVEALTGLAKLSQGFFRRFMEYINIVVSQYVIDNRTNEITMTDVKTLIPSQKIISDMEIQLVALFPNDNQRDLASQVLKLLQQKGTLNQKQIATALNVNEMRVSRVLEKLNNNLTTRVRGKGPAWLISLK